MKHSIQQTAELLAFIAGVVKDTVDAHAKDGKVSVWDATKIAIANLRTGMDAFQGIKDVPKELADISPEEMDVLYHTVMEQLQWPDRMVSRDLFDANYNFLRVCVQHWLVVKNTLHPPKATPIPDTLEGVDPP